MKDTIIKTIKEELGAYGLDSIDNNDADLIFEKTFVSKTWLGGSKSIDYKLYIGIHMNDQTIYFQERVCEKGKGFSFGSSLSTESQMNTTVYRTLKANMFGLDGKAYEIDVNLGDIIKSLKQIAYKNNFKFKEVLMLGKIKDAHDLI
jgi:hypothetical protein